MKKGFSEAKRGARAPVPPIWIRQCTVEDAIRYILTSAGAMILTLTRLTLSIADVLAGVTLSTQPSKSVAVKCSRV